MRQLFLSAALIPAALPSLAFDYSMLSDYGLWVCFVAHAVLHYIGKYLQTVGRHTFVNPVQI